MNDNFCYCAGAHIAHLPLQLPQQAGQMRTEGQEVSLEEEAVGTPAHPPPGITQLVSCPPPPPPGGKP
jgi:hypothetical protein